MCGGKNIFLPEENALPAVLPLLIELYAESNLTEKCMQLL